MEHRNTIIENKDKGNGNGKIKFVPVRAIKACTGSGFVAPLILNLSIR
jgi:hypothetical protein